MCDLSLKIAKNCVTLTCNRGWGKRAFYVRIQKKREKEKYFYRWDFQAVWFALSRDPQLILSIHFFMPPVIVLSGVALKCCGASLTWEIFIESFPLTRTQKQVQQQLRALVWRRLWPSKTNAMMLMMLFVSTALHTWIHPITTLQNDRFLMGTTKQTALIMCS